MILITGAGGKTGQAILRALARRRAPVRALLRRTEQRPAALAAGASEVQVGDLRDPAALRTAVQGVRTVYHICPNMHPDEAAIGATLLAAAKAAGVSYFVYHSVLHPQTSTMPHHWQKLQVEERIFQSGLPFTILQPAVYMQNLLGYWRAIRTQGVYAVPYPVETRLSLVDLEDVAEAAARVLTETGHQGATYELVGAAPLSQSQVAGVLAEGLQQPVRAEALPLDLWEQQARRSGLGDYAIAALRQMFTYYADYGLVGNPNVLRWLLERPPTSLAAFVRRHREMPVSPC
ncbi:MAG TPA: NmrA family NAD(P)-binding protein [Caldilineaceae bacterium]|nr:NmrA family NAD(P)-binding protein [Caldilineaceae bacterium]